MALSQTKLLLLDVDGVLTDGSIHVDDRGVETKRFHVRDGSAIVLWKRVGLEVGLLTGRMTPAVAHRASELGIAEVESTAASRKAEAYEAIRGRFGRDDDEVAYIGDDLADVPVLRKVGVPIAVADAVPEARAVAALVTRRPGGAAAVREAVEHLLRATGRWGSVLAAYGLDEEGRPS